MTRRTLRVPETGRPLWWAAGLGLLLVVIGLPLLAWRLSGADPAPDPGTSPEDEPAAVVLDRGERLGGAGDLLRRLEAGLGTDAAEAVDLGALADPEDDAARTRLEALVVAARELGVREVGLRFVTEEPGFVDERPSTWVGAVALDYVQAGAQVRFETVMRFADTADGVRFVAAGSTVDPEVGRTPSWWSEPLTVRQEGRTTVLAPDEERASILLGQARVAVTQVNRVLPKWRGPLVLEMPATAAALETALGAAPGSYGGIAAVTTTISEDAGAPVHILLHPEVFGGLGDGAAQVVATHEAAHVALGATRTSAPLWLLEGVADHVALRDSDLPVTEAAGQYLERVREDGLPTTLPTEADFDARQAGLGATYEAAWLACRLIVETYGEDALLDLYRAADEGVPVPVAFRRVLGTTEEAFVAAWRDDLRRLADLTG
ncbi:MAG: hypothetical protein Q8Q02_15850 [Nocardioides sp.]|nr:hypothetical protein [Nocardioides sp.]